MVLWQAFRDTSSYFMLRHNRSTNTLSIQTNTLSIQWPLPSVLIWMSSRFEDAGKVVAR